MVPALKLCTFKVAQTATGKKLGELMLKLAFNYAHQNNLASVYLTIFPKYEEAMLLLDDNGFHVVDHKGDEVIVSKMMEPSSDLPSDYDVIGQ